MAPRLVHKFATETPDGILTQYNTPTPYAPGSVIYALNGRAHTQGWTEKGGTLIALEAPPQIGDVVSFWYTQI